MSVSTHTTNVGDLSEQISVMSADYDAKTVFKYLHDLSAREARELAEQLLRAARYADIVEARNLLRNGGSQQLVKSIYPASIADAAIDTYSDRGTS